MRRVTFSRNFTISLSRSCRCYCKYCAFATHQAHLRGPDEVKELLARAERKRAKELLILTGEAPDDHPRVAQRLKELGYGDFVDYVVWVCERALERGILPHTNLGVIGRADIERLREVTASQGLMLESTSERLMDTVHAGSPTKHPRERLAMMRLAGELKVPFTTGILVGIGETPQDRLDSLRAIADLHERYGHIQEVILQNFVPHPRYHGEDVGELADAAAGELWRTGMAPGGQHADRRSLPAWASPVSIDDMRELVRAARELLPGVGIQIPPNLADWWPQLVESGATDLGGLSANGDHISPELPFPSPRQVRERLAEQGVAVAERLCVYPRYIDEQWTAPAVLDTIKARYWSFIPRGERRRGPGHGGPAEPQFLREAIAKARAGESMTAGETTALFDETRPELTAEIRAAADALRAELAGDDVTFVVNRNINFTNICTVGCAFCGFGQSRRSADAYEVTEEHFREKIAEAVEFGASEICLQGGIHPDYELEDYGRWLSVARDAAPQIHLHAYSPMEISHMAERSGRPLDEIFAYLLDCGLGSTPGTAAEVLEDGVRGRISPNKLPAARWVEIIEAAHRAGVPTTSTVMFGHIEEGWELAEHMRVIRELQERSLAEHPAAITEFVPLSFIPFQTLLGRTHGITEISRDENLKHTAVFRLALGRSISNLQASWVKIGVEAATEALGCGVNDLGGTLMEESISRAAGSRHGSRLEPEDLIAIAHAAGRTAIERDTTYSRRLAEYPLDSRVVTAA
ncbi:MAG: 5-amino-6-(D-ribitylamino)uracil--L-tyrosine 4-hydroxyphenyl transferase CofH [Solirubrobacterales bacterium]